MQAALLTLGMIVGLLVICYAAGYSLIYRWWGCVDHETIPDKMVVAGLGFIFLALTFTIGAAILGIYTLAVHILQ
jgi:hypothetical protein